MNINEATFRDLTSIHGIGVATANTILDMRSAIGTLTRDDINNSIPSEKAAILLEVCTFSPPRSIPMGEDPIMDPKSLSRDVPLEGHLTPETTISSPGDAPWPAELMQAPIAPMVSKSSELTINPPPEASRPDIVVKEKKSTIYDDNYGVAQAMALVNRPTINDSATMILINNLKDAVDRLSQQRIEDKNAYDKRLNDLKTHHELQHKEDCERYQALSRRANTERQRFEQQLQQHNQVKLDLQKQFDEMKQRESVTHRIPESVTHRIPGSAAQAKPVNLNNDLARQQLVETAVEYDHQIDDAQILLGRLRSEKETRIRGLQNVIYADPSMADSPSASPSSSSQQSTPVRQTPRVHNLVHSVNRFAPDGVYRGASSRTPTTHGFEPSYRLPPPTAPRERFPPRYNFSPAVERQRNVSNRGIASGTPLPSNRASDSLPKLGKYDGTSQWKSFYIQFKMYSDIKGWTDQQKLNNLCLCLKDKALDFFVCQPDNIQHDYILMIQKLERRFGKKDIAETLRVQFNRMRQNVDEPLEEWAERVQKIAQEAYMNLPDDFMTKEVVRKFCQGISDRESAQYVSDRRPGTIEEALQLVKAHVENNRAIYGSRKSVRQIAATSYADGSFQTHDYSNNNLEPSVLAEAAQPSGSDDDSMTVRSLTRKSFVDLDKQVKKLEDTFAKKFDQLWLFLRSRDNRSPTRQPSQFTPPRRLTPPSSPRTGNCFSCGEAGHYSYECKRKSILKGKPESPKTTTSTGTSTEKGVSFSPLNTKRSDA